MVPMKYVFNRLNGHFALLPDNVGMQHADLFDKNGSWTNAGFVKFETVNGLIKATCYGRSESLNLDSGDIDSLVITNILNKGSLM